MSFVVMREHGITEALTGDHHFEQAGFEMLLTELDKALRAGRLWNPEGGNVHDAATTAVFGAGEGGHPA
jgi:hypothetical protein